MVKVSEASVGILTRAKAKALKKPLSSSTMSSVVDDECYLHLRSRRVVRNAVPHVKKPRKTKDSVNEETPMMSMENEGIDSQNAQEKAMDSFTEHGLHFENQESKQSETMPSAQQLEGFFAQGEKLQNQQIQEFIQKYNFDPVNEKPLEGRYEWTKLKP